MADRRISQLNRIEADEVQSQDDLLALADVSTNETKALSPADLVTAGFGGIADGSITGDKIESGSLNGSHLEENSITERELAPNSVDTIHVKDGAITNEKLAGPFDGSIIIGDGTIDGNQLAPDSIDGELHIQDRSIPGVKLQLNTITADEIASNAITADELASDSVDNNAVQDDALSTNKYQDLSVTNEKLADGIDGGKIQGGTITGDKLEPGTIDGTQIGVIELDNLPNAPANHVLAGPIDGVDAPPTYRPIDPEDLPPAKENAAGAVSVPADGGLDVTAAGELSIANQVAPEERAVVTYDAHGLVTSGRDLTSTDLPLATETEPGAVAVPEDGFLVVDGQGNLRHREVEGDSEFPGYISGTYSKVVTNETGHVVEGLPLEGDDLPEHSGDLITSGELNGQLLRDHSVHMRALADYSTCLIQDDKPADNDADLYLGMQWLQPSTGRLYAYARGSGPQNQWVSIGFGRLTADNLRFGGTFDATTQNITSLTAAGAALGYIVGAPVPEADEQSVGVYLLANAGGNAMQVHDLVGKNITNGDWILSLGEEQGWEHIDINAGGGGGGGGGATVLNDLLDVTIDLTRSLVDAPASGYALEEDQILKYDGIGQWRNVSELDCGTFALKRSHHPQRMSGILAV